MINTPLLFAQISFSENNSSSTFALFLVEETTLEKISKLGELMAFKHEGFWECMDTLKDYESLKERWSPSSGWNYD